MRQISLNKRLKFGPKYVQILAQNRLQFHLYFPLHCIVFPNDDTNVCPS